ncbi:MAG: bifunctional hydroxymethylpyrimidine kinase/phosphomethylpyrimidine kinase [Candidatus Cloacimonetes bacterium]|nr:bifunctional hydroxymethylpyrimidine kinase/phosphomethylpyrimidine kinase [Candidatus Cloacimonadota bacterium]
MRLTLVGSIALDSVKTPYGEVTDALGGSSLYASLAASYFCRPCVVGVIGEDYDSANLDILEKKGIDTSGIVVLPGKTFRWKGVYNDLNRAETLDTQLNVFADFNPVLSAEYASNEYLFLGNIHPSLQLNVLSQLECCKITAMDTMNFWISSAKEELLEVIRRIDIVFVNEDEAKMLTGCHNIYDAAEEILSMGPKLVLLKRGEYGAMAIMTDMMFYAPVYPVKKVVDPTGAGDSFAGGFMGFLAGKGEFTKSAIKEAVIYGTVMASLDVESFSADALLDIETSEIENRRKKIIEIISI